ncbi:MAG: 2-isopropylmalate synthase [Chloroflexi bacterium]|nr:2-isopropylmalate synthase [Chloroflexota bacterium]
MSEYVKIFDTTLRDGEEAPGFALTSPQKLEMAHQLARLGLDVLEAGFPAASEEEFATVQRIAREVRSPIIAALAPPVEAEIDRVWDAIKQAERPRIHTFLTAADVHQQGALGRERAKARAAAMVARARNLTNEVEFSPIDATRSDWAYVSELFGAVIDAGATTVNIPDTCGFAQPDELAAMVTYMFENVSNIARATLSVHCHNDLGLAVANSLAAIKAGVRQVHCCMNGIGERAGNAALEEIVMALSVRRDQHAVDHGINLDQLLPTSIMLQQFTGVTVQPNKAIVGLNAYARDKNGLHGEAMVEDARTYGLHSGRDTLRQRLADLGLLLTQDELNYAFAGYMSLTDYQGEVTDEDLVQIAQNGRRAADGVFDAIGHVYR